MITSFLLWIALAGSPAKHPAATPGARTASTSVREIVHGPSREAQDYETVLAEYEQALKTHKRELRRADRDTRKAMRKSPPSKAFFPRFQALAEAGNGRALLWTLANIKEKGLGMRETREARAEGYSRLVATHAKATWFDEALDQLPRERKYLGTEGLVRMYEKVLDQNESRNIQAQALFQLSVELRRTKDAAQMARADELLERVIAEYGDTDYANSADNDLFIATRLSVGREAPDFDGKTIDGYEFKLSDYRGKIVLVDFYGFW